jgi:RNA polymerase sigma-70 factor (ECF subfamily)
MATETVTSDLDPTIVGLVERAQSGDQNAFAQLYDRYLDQIYGYIRRRVGRTDVAEDLTSDVFLRAYRNLPRFEWQGVDLGAWLTTIARNRVNDHFKSSRFRLERSVGEFYENDPRPSIDDPERIAEAREMARSLASALERLKDEHREVIELRFVHGLDVAATAAVMDRTVGATKALQYRALKALAEIVRDEPNLSQFVAGSISTLIWLLRILP